MSKQLISSINGVDVFAEITENGDVFVPIKPICTAIGVDFTAQRQRITRHHRLSSTVVTITTVAADDKDREMLCLPLKYIYGWLFSIDASLVSEKARPSVEKYQVECYEVLYDHFAGSMKRQIETNEAEIELLKQINAAIADEKEAKTRKKKAEEALAKLRNDRLDQQPTLF